MPKDSVDLNKYFQEFGALAAARHAEGAKEYGELGFMSNDMFAFVYEELADASNYLIYQFAKLRMVQEYLDESGLNPSSFTFEEVRNDDELPSNVASFSTHQEVSGFLPESEL